MKKQLFVLAAIGGLASILMIACGGTSSNMTDPSAQSMGSVVVFGTDAPLCNVASLDATITAATLTPTGGGAPVSVLAGGQPEQVDFASLVGFATVLDLSSVPAGSYSDLTLTLSNPQLMVIDVTQTPPAPVAVTTTLSATTVTVTINPQLNVSAGGAAGLMVDFKMRQSVETDTNGQVTGAINPVFSAAATSATSEDLDDLHGIVQSVSTTSSNSAFTGNFDLQLRAGTGRVFTINVTSSTDFDGVSGLSALTTGTFVEVDGSVDTSGNIIAQQVEAEDQEDIDSQRAAFIGTVLSVTRDTTGNATQFNLLVLEEHPDAEQSVPIRDSVPVNITSDTIFRIPRMGKDWANLPFNASTLGVGQHLVVHGQFQIGANSAPTISARAIFLHLHGYRGNFTSLITAGTDGKTGGYLFTPCNSLFQGKTFTILTSDQTAFAGATDLNGLNPQPLEIVKGLLFYEQSANTINGVTWTPPTWVNVAKVVDQRN